MPRRNPKIRRSEEEEKALTTPRWRWPQPRYRPHVYRVPQNWVKKEDPMGTFKVTPIHESLEEDLAKCSVCSKDVPRTLYCINCGAPIEAKKEAN